MCVIFKSIFSEKIYVDIGNTNHIDLDDVHIDKCLSGCRHTRTALCLCVIVIWSNHNGCWWTQPHFITIGVNQNEKEKNEEKNSSEKITWPNFNFWQTHVFLAPQVLQLS